MIAIEMSFQECREEALRRLAESDRLFAEYADLPAATQRDEGRYTMERAAHLRQTAAVYAALSQY